MTQEQADKSYLKMAKIWAENSTARKLHVGALIVKDKMIISDGFNGTPSGFDNNCETEQYEIGDSTKCPKGCFCTLPLYNQFGKSEEYNCNNIKTVLKTKPEVLHAEANAITKVAKSTQSCEGATMYCTDSPCIECAKLIVQAGIKRLVYSREYHKTEGLELLIKANIQINKINIDE